MSNVEGAALAARRLFYASRHSGKFIGDIANDYGLAYLGFGHFSIVFKYGCLAVKFSSRALHFRRDAVWSDGIQRKDKPGLDGWQLFARFCQGQRSPNLPSILHYEQVQYGTAFAVMPVYERVDYEEASDVTSDWEDQLRGYKTAEPWLVPVRQMVETLDLRIDLHDENIMRDPCTHEIILTDPFSTAGEY